MAKTKQGKPKTQPKKIKILKSNVSDVEKSIINLEKIGLATLTAGLGINKSIADNYVKNGLGLLNIAQEQMKPLLQSMQPMIDFSKIAQEQMKPFLQSVQPMMNFNTALQEQMKPFLQSMQPMIDFSKIAQEQMKPLLQSMQPMIDFSKIAQEQINSFTISSQIPLMQNMTFNIPASSLMQLTDFSEKVLKEANKNLLSVSNRYYSEPSLEILKQPTKISPESKTADFAKRLQKCKEGVDWSEYQEICSDVLSYCFGSQLLEPFSQDESASGLHKRDFIFPFSREIEGFWKYVQNKFGMGLGIVVECKNHSEPLKENDIIITSKYLGAEKYTAFGLILSRKGIHENGMKAIVGKWTKEKIMLLSLTDSELLKMLELKESSDEPTKVIEDLMSKFLRSLE